MPKSLRFEKYTPAQCCVIDSMAERMVEWVLRKRSAKELAEMDAIAKKNGMILNIVQTMNM